MKMIKEKESLYSITIDSRPVFMRRPRDESLKHKDNYNIELILMEMTRHPTLVMMTHTRIRKWLVKRGHVKSYDECIIIP